MCVSGGGGGGCGWGVHKFFSQKHFIEHHNIDYIEHHKTR